MFICPRVTQQASVQTVGGLIRCYSFPEACTPKKKRAERWPNMKIVTRRMTIDLLQKGAHNTAQTGAGDIVALCHTTAVLRVHSRLMVVDKSIVTSSPILNHHQQFLAGRSPHPLYLPEVARILAWILSHPLSRPPHDPLRWP